MKKKIKKAFTLVELLVVIAIIAILATVSIVGYNSFTKKAKVSNDTVLVKQMNDVLIANSQTDDKNNTMTDALNDVLDGGYDLNKLTPTTTNYNIMWDSAKDEMVLLDESLNVVYPEDNKIAKKDLYVIVENESEMTGKFAGYSYYLKDNFVIPETKTLKVSTGLDAGNVKGLTNITYENTGDKQTVALRTNSGKLTVNAEKDVVYYYGNASEVYVQKVDKDSYHENGTVDLLTVEYGHVDVATNGKITTMVVAPTSADAVTVTAKKNQIESVVAKCENAASVVDSITKDTGATTMKCKNISSLNNFNDKDYFINGYLQKNAYVVMDENYKFENKSITMLTPSTKLVLDLNGKRLDLNSFTINNTCKLTILDSVGTGEIYFHGKWSMHGIDIRNEGGVATLNGGTLYANSEYSMNSYGSIVYLTKGTTFIMNGGKLVSNHTNHDYGSLAVCMFSGNTKFVMNGGEIEKTAGVMGAIMASGNGSSGTTIEINGGSIKSNTVAIYHPQNGSLTINDGYIEGQTAVYVKCGSITLNGGELKAIATTKTDYEYNGNGCVLTGDALVIDACGYPDKDPVVTINGGKYTTTASGAHGIAHYKYNGNFAIITNNTNIEVFEQEISA